MDSPICCLPCRWGAGSEALLLPIATERYRGFVGVLSDLRQRRRGEYHPLFLSVEPGAGMRQDAAMRVALLSDIHANLPALEAVEKDVDAQGVDAIFCLGDTLGYGPFPNECIDWLRDRATHSLSGNHDLALLEWLDASTYHPDALSALEWQRGVLRTENRRWLATLGERVSQDGFEAMHGAPPRPLDFEYLLGLDGAQRMIARFPDLALTTFIGHSHLTKCFAVYPGGVYELMADRLRTAPEARLIVTVGSVGQPRDTNPKAAWVLFDTETREVCFRRVAYPVRKTAQAIRARRLPSFLAERLQHGI